MYPHSSAEDNTNTNNNPPSKMAAAFITALRRISFNAPTSQKIADEGFARIKNLAEVSDDDINALVKHIGTWKPHLVAGAAVPSITLPFLSVRILRAMRLWVVI